MSAQKIPGPLIVRPWIDHSATTIGYVTGKDRFVALADCSIGPDFAVTYEPLARLFSAAPDLLAALEEITNDYSDRFDLNSPSTNPGIKSSIAQARAAIAKGTQPTAALAATEGGNCEQRT